MNHLIPGLVVRLIKKVTLPVIASAIIFAAVAAAQPTQDRNIPPPTSRQFRLVLAHRSTADPVEIMKHLSQSCPNISMTTNPKQSDYMLYAGGWSGDYRFMVIAKGGATIYATETVLLSTAVKNVCKFLDAR